MSVVNALTNFGLVMSPEGGDTGRGRVEHRSFNSCCSLNILRAGQFPAWYA